MREFGKVYNGKDDVYIKIRVELFGMYGNATTFVMSFHFAENHLQQKCFPIGGRRCFHGYENYKK